MILQNVGETANLLEQFPVGKTSRIVIGVVALPAIQKSKVYYKPSGNVPIIMQGVYRVSQLYRRKAT